MSIFSLFLILIAVLMCLKLKNKRKIFLYFFAMSLSLEMMIDVGYFIKLGNFELGYSEVGYIILVLYILFYFSKDIFRGKNWLGFLLLISVSLSLVIQFLIPYDQPVVADSNGWDRHFYLGEELDYITISFSHIKEIIHVFCYIIVFMYVRQIDNKSDKFFFKYLEKFFRGFIIFGVIELLLVKVLHQQELLTNLEKLILGDSYFADGTLVSIGTSGRLRGLKSEPSMYSYVLFIVALFYLFISKVQSKKRCYLFAFLSVFIMLMSLSFSTIFCLAIAFLIYLGVKFKKSTRKGRIVIIGLSLTVLIAAIIFISYVGSKDHFDNYYLERIRMSLLSFQRISSPTWNDTDYLIYDASSLIRVKSMLGSLNYLKDRPLFGLALGSTYTHGPLFTAIASIGIIGIIIWYLFTFDFTKKHTGLYKYLVFLRLLSICFVGSGLFPFYGLECILVYKMLDIYSSRQKTLSFINA